MKKILVLPDLNMKKMGSEESFFIRFAQSCRRKSFEIAFLLTKPPISNVYNELINAGAKIIILEDYKDKGVIGTLKFVLKVGRLININKYNLVVFRYYDEVIGFLIMFLTKIRLKKTNFIWHECNELSNMSGISKPRYFIKRNISFMRILSFFVDKICPVSNEVRRQFLMRKVLPYKLVTLHNGVDLSRFDNDEETKCNFLKFLNATDIVITTIVNHRQEKGLDFLLKAMPAVLADLPNTKLIVVGDKALTKEHQQLSKQLKIQNNIIPLGLRNDIPRILKHSDIYVQPSLKEAFPFSILEAMAAARPVVASKVGGIPELVRDNKNGLLVPPANPEALAKSIIKLAKNKNFAEQLGKEGRKIVEKIFTIEKTIDRYFSVYLDYLEKETPKKVLFIEFGSGYGGSGQSLFKLLKTIDKNKFKPVVVYANRGVILEQIEELGIKTIHVNYKVFKQSKIKNRFLLYFLELLHFLFVVIPNALKIYLVAKSERIDIFHLNNNILVNLPGIIAAKLYRAPVITHIRCTRNLTKIERLFINFVNRCVLLTNDAKKLYKLWIPQKRLSVIYNGLDFEGLVKHEDNYIIRREFSLDSAPIIGIVGRLVEGKGQDDFLKAAAVIIKNKPEARFLIVGSNPTGNENTEKQLKDLAQRLNLDGKVIFMGWRRDAIRIMSIFDILVQASSTFPEGLPNVIIEGMALRKPIVATDIPGSNEIVLNQVTGFLVPPNNPDIMAEKILTLLNNKELAIKMGKAGRKRAEELFDIRENAKEIEQMYGELVNLKV